MKDPNREKHVQDCRDFVLSFPHRFLVRYIRDKRRNRIGVMVAWGDKIGWSRCNVKHDVFDRWIGTARAIKKVAYYCYFANRCFYHDVPSSIRCQMKDFLLFLESEQGIQLRKRMLASDARTVPVGTTSNVEDRA